MAVLAALAVAATKSPAEEGRDVILVMLVTGLIFLGVIALGQLGRWYGHKRAAERARRRRVY